MAEEDERGWSSANQTTALTKASPSSPSNRQRDDLSGREPRDSREDHVCHSQPPDSEIHSVTALSPLPIPSPCGMDPFPQQFSLHGPSVMRGNLTSRSGVWEGLVRPEFDGEVQNDKGDYPLS